MDVSLQSPHISTLIPHPPPIQILSVDAWLHITAYLTRQDLDTLWQCGNTHVHALCRQLKRAPYIVIQPRAPIWPSWMAHCHRLNRASIGIERIYRCKSIAKSTDFNESTGITCQPTFWHRIMAMSSPQTLETLKLCLNVDATEAFWTAACDDECSQSSPTASSALDKLRSKFPRLTSLRMTISDTKPFNQGEVSAQETHRAVTLNDWILNNTQTQPSSSHSIDEQVMSASSNTITTPFYTLHLSRLAEYQPDTPSLMQHLPSTLTDLKLSFYDMDTARHRITLTPPSAIQTACMKWSKHTTQFPAHLARLSLKGVPSCLLRPSVLASLQHLGRLCLIFVEHTRRIERMLPSMKPFIPSPLSQLPSNLHSLELGDITYDRLVAHVEQIPATNSLTSLVIRESRLTRQIDESLAHFKRIIECVVSDVKFQQLKTLYIWGPSAPHAHHYKNYMPSLSGMTCMRQLQSISSLFLQQSAVSHDSWYMHIPLPTNDTNPPLYVATTRRNQSVIHSVEIDHDWANAKLLNEVLPKMRFDAVNWATSRSDVQLPPKLASCIHTVRIRPDPYRNNWNSDGETNDASRETPLSSLRRLNWVHSIQHLPNVTDLVVDRNCDMSHMRDLACVLRSFRIPIGIVDTPLSEACFSNFTDRWASHLVTLSVVVSIVVADATRFMESLPSTLEALRVSLIFENDPVDIANAEYSNRFKPYAMADQEERSRREIRFLPPRLRECRLTDCAIYMTNASIRCVPKTLSVAVFSRVLDAVFDRQLLLTLPSSLSICILTIILCSNPELSNDTVRSELLVTLWRKLPALKTLNIALPLGAEEDE